MFLSFTQYDLGPWNASFCSFVDLWATSARLLIPCLEEAFPHRTLARFHCRSTGSDCTVPSHHVISPRPSLAVHIYYSEACSEDNISHKLRNRFRVWLSLTEVSFETRQYNCTPQCPRQPNSRVLSNSVLGCYTWSYDCKSVIINYMVVLSTSVLHNYKKPQKRMN